MSDSGFKYDVAFSFLGPDEPLAVRLRDLLERRVRTFIYSDAERQATLAGRDGEEAFTRVFGREARLVVVLYRKGWGESGFTAVEATAIRNRAYKDGYDFTLFIPLDDPPEVPSWLPRTRLWHGLQRWGVEGAAAAIESRIEEAGGTPKSETIEEIAARVRDELMKAADRAAFLDSSDGVNAAREEFELLCTELGRAASQTAGMVVKRGPEGGIGAILLGDARRVNFMFEPAYINTLKGSVLRVVEWDGRTSHQRYPHIQSPDLNVTTEFDFDVNMDGQRGWRKRGARDFLTTALFAESLVRALLERIGTDSQGAT